MVNSEFGSPFILLRFYVSEPRARLLYYITNLNNYFPKIAGEIYSSLVGKVTGLSRLLRLGLPPCPEKKELECVDTLVDYILLQQGCQLRVTRYRSN